MAPRHLAALLLTLALAACASPSPSASISTATLRPTASASQTTPRPTPSGPLPARPYDGAAVLQAMRDSRRPGGVPTELQTAEIAAAVANELWTWDGAPWPDLVIGGSCGGSSCSLEVAGTPPDAAGADLYVLSIEPTSATVSVESTDLHGYPRQLDGQLKAIATEVAPDAIRGLRFASAQWMPTAAGQYLLAYRSGGEEGSPGVDLLIDASSRTLLDQHRV
ncbi:MAG TPA: hypothetical protein VFL75_08830 [Candidatus Limnocylindria bacterium]|nr:hypothetical protein [Candidatus Limnocylindria bacterium]